MWISIKSFRDWFRSVIGLASEIAAKLAADRPQLGNANLKSRRYQDDWIETNDWLSAVKPIDPQYPHVIPVDPKMV